MKTLQLYLSTLLLIVLSACSPNYPIPKEVKERQKEHINRSESRSGGPDVILDPIETTPVYPNVRTLNRGNWAYRSMEVDKYASLIAENAKRHVDCFIFDTSGDYIDINLKPITKAGGSYTGEPPLGTNNHSHHVAGIIGGETEGSRVIGLAEPVRDANKLTLHPYKVLSNGGSGSFRNIVRAGEDALKRSIKLIEKGHFVIWNYSLGGGSSYPPMDDLFKRAEDAGILIVAAAGNTGREGVQFPAKSSHAKAIAATDHLYDRTYFSTMGPEVHGAAPGLGIYSIIVGGDRAVMSGTSMSTPVVAAIYANLAAINPEATADDLVRHFERYSIDKDPKGRDKEVGFGIPRLGELLAHTVEIDKPQEDEPEDPEDEPVEDEPEEDEPEEDEPVEEEPEEDEPVYDKNTGKFYFSKTYTIPWRTRDQSREGKPFNMTKFRVAVEYTSKKGTMDAYIDSRAYTSNHFRGRGYILPNGSTDVTAMQVANLFFNAQAKQDGKDMEFWKAWIEMPDGGELIIEQEELNDWLRGRLLKACKPLTYTLGKQRA